jgi:hypothetical protein
MLVKPFQLFCSFVLASWVGGIFIWATLHLHGASSALVLKWWLSQWFPFESISRPIRESCWQELSPLSGSVLELPEIDVQKLLQKDKTDLISQVQQIHGSDWRSRPLLLRNVWTRQELNSSDRRLSLQGLLKEHMIVPYFTNVSRPGALVPDSEGRISAIVANISKKALPHKIGTQLLARKNPELIYEVAPNDVMTNLFGPFFSPKMVQGFLNGWMPPLTVVPLFVAKAKKLQGNDTTCLSSTEQPRTDMHCEPIANILVQLEGEKEITLISPEYSLYLKPGLSPDRRAYIYSQSRSFDDIPRYIHTIQKGDAIYVPTWTWHRVDYTFGEEVAISGSLFHFRPLDFVRRNPLHAAVILPNLLLELTGCKLQ